MYSIRKKLVRSISIVLAILLITMFSVVDFTLDAWAEKQFNDSLKEKANLLITLVKEYESHVEFDFAGEFMPKFESKLKDEFFQLWRNDKTFEKSDSLNGFTGIELYRTELPIGSSIFIDQTLPDGRDGRIFVYHFLPQIQSGRGEIIDQKSMYLSIAVPLKDLDSFLGIIDSILLLTLVITILCSRYIVTRVIKHGLAPLFELNEKIKKIDITQSDPLIDKPEILVTEIEPIRNELNKFIIENKLLIEHEKRLTSDITHEIKTPITEIISLTEMSIKYPDEWRINKSYKEDILNSANRLKDIVQKLAILHRSASQSASFAEKECSLAQTIQDVLASLSYKYPERIANCVINNPDSIEKVIIDEFCFNTVLTNLLDNAFFYGKTQHDIQINIIKNVVSRVKIEVKNYVARPLTTEQLAHLFEPFYQVDQSRTDSSHHGLGLAIIKNLSDLAKYNLVMDYHDEAISFTFEVRTV